MITDDSTEEVVFFRYIHTLDYHFQSKVDITRTTKTAWFRRVQFWILPWKYVDVTTIHFFDLKIK